MPVIFNSKKIIPVQTVNISRETTRGEDGTPLRSVFVINVKGTAVAFKGSPDSTGTFWTAAGYPPDETVAADSRLASLRDKMGALGELFSSVNDGKLFEVQPYDGSAPIKANVIIRSITFQEDVWFDKLPYEIVLECNSIYFGSRLLSTETSLAEENWSIDFQEDRKTYRAQHRVSSAQKTTYLADGTVESKGWERARTIVLAALGFDSAVVSSSNALDLSTWEVYNYSRSQNIDEVNGRYEVNESWVLYDDSITGGIGCLETYTITDRLAEDQKRRVSIEGTLTGLEARNSSYEVTTTRYANAEARYAALAPTLFSLCQTYTGVTLNTTPLATSVARNPDTGVITFSREFDNRNEELAGAISISVQVTINHPKDVFAEILVLGRSSGPVIQSIETITSYRKTVAIEVVMPAKTNSFTPTQPDVGAIVAANLPPVAAYYIDKKDESWNDRTGRYSFNITWAYNA